MENLTIKKSAEFPGVNFNAEKGQLKIAGKSYMEDSAGFYNPILAWLNEYKLSPNKNTLFEFGLEYMNTSSSKFVLDIFQILNEIQTNTGGVKVTWIYFEEDEDMEEAGKQFEEMFSIPFTFKGK